jgi:stringent starvation protein B
MSHPDRPTKQQAFLALLKEGWTSLHVDARRAGVIVPADFAAQAHLVLQYGYDLPIAIPDLRVDDRGVRATLSFSRTPQVTFVPWSAVYAVSCLDGRGVLYSEDIPTDVSVITNDGDGADRAGAAMDEGVDDDVAELAGSADRVMRRLQSVPAPAEAEAEPDVEGPLAARRRRRPQLRLVK